MLTLFILVPILGIMILNLPLWNLKKVAAWFGFIILSIQIWLSFFSPETLAAPLPYNIVLPFKFNIAADSFSILMLLAIAIVGMASLILGQYTIESKEDRFNFVNLLILAVTGMNGVVIVADLFSLYVFMEVVAVASFVLIASKQDKLGLEGSMKYLILSSLATVLMLASIALLMLTAGGTTFSEVSNALRTSNNGLFTMVALGLFITGLFIKGGLVPFHGWLPDAYSSAPAEVSVLLAGIVTKTSGIYTLMRILTSVFDFTPSIGNILLVVGIVSVFAGALAALSQNDIKRMLAYSSISQVGYIILGLGTGTGLGFAGAAFHLFNHSIFKSQLFVNAAAIEKQTGTREISKLGGLSAKMPVTSTTSLIAMLSTAGVPPLGGFWSKLLIIVALWMSGHHYLALAGVLGSVITLAYFLSMNRRVFFGNLPENLKDIKEATGGMLVPAVGLAVITVSVGVFFPIIINLLILPLMNLIP